MPRPSDYSIIPNGRHYAVTRCGLIVPGFEQIDSYGDAQHHIEGLEDADRIEAEEEAAAVADLAAEDAIDAYHEGYFAPRSARSPYAAGQLASAWGDGHRDARRDRRRRVAMQARPEGYFHARLEAL